MADPRAQSQARRCQQCGGAMPDRMHRQRNEGGRLVCDNCKRWPRMVTGFNEAQQQEFGKRAAEAAVSIMRAGTQRTAHDSGDNALLNHCPFCGSGAITGGSDGSVDCDYCHTVFTVQVQPAHPNMPQTIDGQPMPPPGMPAGEETEMSAPVDPAVDEDESGAPADAFGEAEADPTEQAGIHDPGADQDVDKGDDNPFAKKKKKGENPFAKKSGGLQTDAGWIGMVTNDDSLNWYLREGAYHASVREVSPGAFQWMAGNAVTFEPIGEGDSTSLDMAKAEAEQMLSSKARADSLVYPKAASAPQFREGARFFTTEGETLPMGSYVDRLALDFADDRMAVLGSVRIANDTPEVVFVYPYGGDTEAHLKGCKATTRGRNGIAPDIGPTLSISHLKEMQANPDEGYVKVHTCLKPHLSSR